MSSSYSKVVTFVKEGQGPEPQRRYEGRFWFHHTSDTTTWQIREVAPESKTEWDDRIIFDHFGDDNELDAFVRALTAKD